MMKALIIKDLYMLQKQLKLMGAVLGIYAVIFAPQGMLDMLAFMTVMFCTMFVMTLMSYDETLKWDSFALCGPLTRRDMVNARYAATLMLMAAGFLLALLFYVAMPLFVSSPRSLPDSLIMLSAICLAALLMLSIIIPGMYKLGAEKGRLLMIVAVMVPVASVILYSRYAPPGLTDFFVRYASYFPLALALLAIAALFISYKISLRIYCRKDF